MDSPSVMLGSQIIDEKTGVLEGVLLELSTKLTLSSVFGMVS